MAARNAACEPRAVTDGPIGLVHPGEMGAAVGACLRAAGHDVVWASAGRSPATEARAEAAGLRDVGTLDSLASACPVVMSVCPPHAAAAQAEAVRAAGFRGLYVDANAIAPGTARRMGEAVMGAGASFVDGGIVGPPPTRAGVARLYLSGDDAAVTRVAGLFEGTLLEAIAVDGDVGAASALKMTYAAWSKGTLALLLATIETARHEGVEDALRAEWARSQPDVDGRARVARASADAKGWRWVGEMREIAATFAGADQPVGFHLAAAEVFAAAAEALGIDVQTGRS